MVDTISEQWQVTPSHDITKLISCFTTEVLLTGKVLCSLGGLFSFARMNSAKLIGKAHKVTKSISRATTPEGITTHLNKVVKHTQRTSKAGHATNRGTTKLRKTGKTIQERFEQRLQSRHSTERISKQSATELRQTRPKATKEFVQQRRSYQPAKTENIAKAVSQAKPTIKKTTIKKAKKIWSNSKEFKKLKNITKKLSKTIDNYSKSKYLDNMSSTKYLKHVEEAEKFYENIRLQTNDIIKISKNTGIPKKLYKKLKTIFFMKNIYVYL